MFGDLLHPLDVVGHAVAVCRATRLRRVDALGDPVDAEVARAGRRLRRLGHGVGVAVGVGVVGRPRRRCPEDPLIAGDAGGRAGTDAQRAHARQAMPPPIRQTGPARAAIYRRARRALRRTGGDTSALTAATRMRVALAQIDPTVGDIDGNAAKIAEWIGRARGEGAELVDLPRALRPRLPGRGPLPEAPFRRGQPAGDRRAGPRGRGDRRPGRFRRAGRRRWRLPPRPQLARRARRRRRAGGLPQEPPAQLRRLRRAALLHPGRGAGDGRGRRPAGRPDRLRGRLGAGPPGLDRGGERRAA